MQINVTPHKLAAQEIEVLLDAPASPLELGQVLRIESAPAFYGEITELQEEAQHGILRAKLAVCYGEPRVPFHLATVLSPQMLAAEIQQLRDITEYPFSIGEGFTSSLLSLGTLTLLTGPVLQAKQKALLQLMRGITPYQKLLILDPVGMLAAATDIASFAAGAGFRLTLQQVGLLRFLSAFEKTLPEALRPEALQLCTQILPDTPKGLPFGYLLQRERYPDSPAKAMLLHSLGDLARTRLFAESDAEAFSFSKVLKSPMNVLNLSVAPYPWKTLLYESLCQEILKYPETDAVFVLIYPERYLADVLPWLTQAEALGLTLIVLASPEEKPSLRSLAGNRLHVQSSEAMLQGSLTLGFPVSLWQFGQTASPKTAPTLSEVVPPPAAPKPFEAMEIQPLREDPIRLDTSDIPPVASVTVTESAEKTEDLEVEDLEPILPTEGFEEEWSWVEPNSEEAQPEELQFDLSFLDSPAAPPEGEVLKSANALDDAQAGFAAAPVLETLDVEESWAADEEVSLMVESVEEAWQPVVPDVEELEPPEQDIIPIYRTQPLEQQASEPQSPYQAGERIRHEKYGLGLVTKVIPMEGSVVLNITFDSVGKRLLDPALTSLEKV